MASDSRFIQASVRTLFVDISWAIAGTRPCSSHFTFSIQSSAIASTDSKPDFDSALCHVLLRGAHGEFSEMKNTCSENRVGTALQHALSEMIELADTSARDHRDTHRLGNGAREREIEAFAGTVAVHAREQDFARAQLLHFTRPFDGVQSGRPASTMGKHPPANPGTRARLRLFGVDGDDDALSAVATGGIGDQLRVLD